MPFILRYMLLLFLLILFNCGDLFDFSDRNNDCDELTTIETTVDAAQSLSGDKSFSVVFHHPNPLRCGYVLQNFVLNSSNYADTVCFLEIEAHNTVRINYRQMPDMDMDIILTGDAFPNKINNIKQNDSFNEEIRGNGYYYRQYSVINDRQLDSLRITTKNISQEGLEDFKVLMEAEGLIIYRTSDYSQSIGIRLYTIMADGFSKSILKKLVLNEYIKYIQPIAQPVSN